MIYQWVLKRNDGVYLGDGMITTFIHLAKLFDSVREANIVHGDHPNWKVQRVTVTVEES